MIPSILTVEIITSEAGNCNGDDTVSAADIRAVVLEIFDGDGTKPGNASGGTFVGKAECDANEDGIISTADISCVALIIFRGPDSCGTPFNNRG